jgi:hypothetical protein
MRETVRKKSKRNSRTAGSNGMRKEQEKKDARKSTERKRKRKCALLF